MLIPGYLSSPPEIEAFSRPQLGEGMAGDAMVSLAVLLRREMSWERIEKPDVLYGEAGATKKGEDFTLVKTECQRVAGEGDTTFSVFAIFDGHNGSSAAVYSKEHLLSNILRSIPSDLSKNEWLQALPRALVAGFVKTDVDLKETAYVSGTTVTLVIIDGWFVTVASVGDSLCILESAEGSIYSLSADHRLELNKEEVERITRSGGEVGRMNVAGAAEFGPLRCWPGGLCLSRSIGDTDIGEFIIPVPHVKQVKLSNAGGRLVISSDGVWDNLSAEEALSCCRGLPAEAAAIKIVKEAVQIKGLRDDTTCIVVDVLPQEKISPLNRAGKGAFKYMFRRRSSTPSLFPDRDYYEADMVEEIFEDGSPSLAQRLCPGFSISAMFKLFNCAICQLEMRPGEGVSVHNSSTIPGIINPWDGPFLCSTCQTKKEAMEGKQLYRELDFSP